MRALFVAATSSFAVLASACASPGPAVTPQPEVAPTFQVLDSVPTSVRPIKWRGTLNPVQTRSGYAGAPSVRTKTSGHVELETPAATPGRTHARVTVASPVASARDYRWAVLPGRCGAGGALPLVGYDVFPSIEVGSNGRGELSQQIPVAMPATGPLHVNIYSSGQQISEVIACANLRREES